VFRITRFRLAVVLLVVVGAFFVDGYSLIYRYLVVHEPLGTQLTSAPSLFGRPLYIHRGLDLQGGTELTIEICHGRDVPNADCRNGPPHGATLAQAQQATIPILDLRVNSLGVSEATVQAQGDDQILVQLPGVSLKDAIQTIGTTSRLYFATAIAGAATSPPSTAVISDQQGHYDVNQFPDTALYPTGFHWKIDDALDATDVNTATVGTDANTGAVTVDINFNSAGASEWAKITNAAFAAYSVTPTSPQAQIAIFLDNDILTAPFVQSGGQSNQTQITGGFTADSATQLADLISAGALPAEITTVASTTVSATLGQQSVTLSLIAGGIGLLIVVIFMIGYYRFPGLLATVALIVYAAIVLALFKLIPVTLSLAGLAGFVLSVGMAVDANVLIFERTRDELRHGRSVPLAVETGFRRAFPAIRDSNVSTLITCVILGIFGTDVIKGFAITLAIGVIVSFFTAITITRSLFAWVLSWKIGRNPRLYTEIHEEFADHPPRGNFDIVKNRNWYFLGSLAVIIPGILAIVFWGFNLGIDFKGGNVIDVGFKTAASQSQVASFMEANFGSLRPAVQSEGTSGSEASHFAISTLPSDSQQLVLIQNKLDAEFKIATGASTHQPDISIQTVGPTIAASLVTGAIIMIFVAAGAIAIYLAFAFRRQRAISPWRFSACAFFKLLHDVFVLAGIWAILGHFTNLGQVDSLFVTAVLTSVAFSIHDTIVVFDRVRENLRVGPRLTFDQVINLSTVQTMTRSLNTSLTVVFVLLSLVIFGGDSIRGFVLALLIGIVTGTYSSIFNASTLLVAWEKARGSRTAAAPPAGRRRVTTRTA
jgi:SecD/SecF fusion protein